MKKALEQKVAFYLWKKLHFNTYAKMADWMGKDKDDFNDWVYEIGRNLGK